jgi:hypothetical protein
MASGFRMAGRPDGPGIGPSRSFVVQFGDATTPSAGVFVGRIEHIESGRSRRFTGFDELAAFVAEVLEGDEDDGRS